MDDRENFDERIEGVLVRIVDKSSEIISEGTRTLRIDRTKFVIREPGGQKERQYFLRMLAMNW
jgi:hypothetical protein